MWNRIQWLFYLACTSSRALSLHLHALFHMYHCPYAALVTSFLSARVSAVPGSFLWDGSRRGVRGIKTGLLAGRAEDRRNSCPNACWCLLRELWDVRITHCKTWVKQVSVACSYSWVSKEERRRKDWISVKQPVPWVSLSLLLISVLRYKELWKRWDLTASFKLKFFMSSTGTIF